MLSQDITNSLELMVGALPLRLQAHSILLAMAACCALALILWRAWRFTITPALYPSDPKELPYWTPILGHGIAFYNNSNELLERARSYFGNTKEPFAITVAGSKMYVLTKSQDVAEAYRNTRTLSFNGFVQAMMRACGNTEFCVQEMYNPLSRDKEGFPNPHGKPLATLAREMHIHQLFPGENLNYLGSRFLEYFENHLSLKGMKEQCLYAVSSSDTDIVLPLMEWSSDVFTKAGQRAYFGDELSKIDPDLTRVFIIFDELSWQVLYQYPDFMASTMKSARNQIQRALKKYIQIPQEKRDGDAWFTKAMENEMRALNISDDDIATMLVTIYWGINTNTRKACFWMLAYILHKPELVEIVREETKAALTGDKTDIHYLNDKCPRLNAMWNETIRMSAYSASVRFITEDTVIGGKLLRKGNRLMIPYRQLHFDDTVFGDPVHEFQPERFLKNQNLTRSASWRPFGGGNTMCPGRFVAKQAVITFIAMLLHRFDLEVVSGQPFPQPEEGKPVLGIMSNKDGQDLKVRVTSRKTAA